MADNSFAYWKDLSIDEHVRRKYRVESDLAHLIAQKYLTLALAGLDPGTTIREAYTKEQRDQLLDRAAAAVLTPMPHRA